MPKKLELNPGERAEIETVGAVIRSRGFLHLFGLAIISDTILIVLSCGDYWPTICQRIDGMLYGLIGSAYTVAITSTSVTIAWILVDDCSWFFKSIVHFSCSVLYTICGMYYLYVYFQEEECHIHLPPLMGSSGQSYVTSNSGHARHHSAKGNHSLLVDVLVYNYMYSCYFYTELKEFSPWTPILITLLICVGVIYFLYSVYLLITLDVD